MKKHSLIALVVIIVFLLVGVLTVSAAGVGSLTVVDVESPVRLYQVATIDGRLTGAFQDAPVKRLTAASLGAKNAKILAQFAKDHDLSGWDLTPNQYNEVSYTSLDENIYLVCSHAPEPEFAPFLVAIPTRVDDQIIYHIQAEPKSEEPTEPTRPPQPTEPVEPDPEIPQTGNSVLPQYLLFAVGTVILVLGFVEIIRGKEKQA